MTTARNYRNATADELAAAMVHHRLETIDDIKIRYDDRLRAPYGVEPDTRLIVVPACLDWRQKHARINRCWLYFMGGHRLAEEFAPLERDDPDRHLVGGAGTVPLLRRVW